MYEDESDGLDYFGCDEIGFEAMDLAKMGTGLLSGFGGMFGGGGGAAGAGGPTTQNAQVAAMERQKLEDEKKRAEQSASTMKTILVGGVAVVGTVLAVTLLKRK